MACNTIGADPERNIRTPIYNFSPVIGSSKSAPSKNGNKINEIQSINLSVFFTYNLCGKFLNFRNKSKKIASWVKIEQELS